MSRLPSFRARTITVDAQLVIVRSQDELTEEGTVTRVVHHGHQQLDRENEEARARPPPRAACAGRPARAPQPRPRASRRAGSPGARKP
jgi:hypothetical protein